MDDKRQFFRMNNNGEIDAYCDGLPIEVINISASGVLIKKNTDLPATGILALKIHYASLRINYKILRINNNDMVLI
ncbi:MAG: PilZ domain-containing protein, partial [Legionellales bacterium]